MDKQQARFILQSFRPDGADASDADFAEALELAVSDRELGEWLAGERATDAQFATALCAVEIPEPLRQHILSVMRGEKPGDPEIDQEMDALLQSSLADVQPPDGLRDQILTAMHVQAGKGKVTSIKSVGRGGIRRFFQVAAVAAALALGVFLAVQVTGEKDDRLASYQVQQAAGAILNAKSRLDERSADISTINTWLVSHDLPVTRKLPERLQKMKSVGCKKITLPGGKTASLVCFTEEGARGSVHLIIIKNEYVKDNDLPAMDKVRKSDCYHCAKTDWDVVRWKDSEHTYILMARNGDSGKNDMLRYF